MHDRGRVVVKLGGTTLAEQRATLAEVAAEAHHREIIVVHGGGKRLTEWLGRMGVQTRFLDGRRVTDDDAMEMVSAVLRGVVNAELVASLRAEGANAVGASGLDGGTVLARRIPDLGRAASPARVNPALLEALLAGGYLPVVAPVCIDELGLPCNVNADDLAAALAGAMHARLVLLTDSDGVLDSAGRQIPTLSESQAETLIADGTITGGMVPKVRAALASLTGAPEAVIADGSGDRALSRALDDPSSGTRLRGAAGSARPPT